MADRRLHKGDTYTPDDEEGGHAGHLVTVLEVRPQPASSGPDPDDGGPDVVTVECSCGERWTFEDRPE